MRVLSVLAILYSFYTCTCINSDDEDSDDAKEKKYKSPIRQQLEEEMANLRLGAKPKKRLPLTNQFPVDYYGLRKEIEDEIGEGGTEKWVKEQGRRAKEELRRRESEEKERRERQKQRHRHPPESHSHHGHHTGHSSYSGDQPGIKFHYPPYDPNAKNISPIPILPPPAADYLKKPPYAVPSESYVTSGASGIYDDVIYPQPPPTSFPRPCSCTGPRHSSHVEEQGAVGGAPEPQDQPSDPIDPDNPQMPEVGMFEFHKRFERPDDPNQQGPYGGVQVMPPPPPPRPFQNVRPPLPPQRPRCYEDITYKLNEITLETKDKDNAYNTDFRQFYGANGSLCHEFTPVPRNVFIEVTHRGETIWKTTNNRRCTKVQICNIGFTDKIAILFFSTGDQATFRKRKNKWYRV